MNCQDAIAALMQSIDTGAPLSDAVREHLRECEHCRALLATVSQDAPLRDDADVDRSATAAEAAVAEQRRNIVVKRGIAIVAAIVVFGLLLLVPMFGRDSNLGSGEIALITVTGVFIAILIGAPVLLLFSAVSNAKTRTGERRFYKRLGPGRWLAGVCIGIAEAMRWNVSYVRLAFALLVWFKGLGLLAYIICDLAMPPHPADRQYMLRFKIARAWRRMRHADEAGQHG